MVTHADAHDAYVAEANAQRARLVKAPSEDRWDGSQAQSFRVDPRRVPDAVTSLLLEAVRPNDVVLDIGGGAGRFALPLALHCREVINIDPSGGMREQFMASAKEAGIDNVRYVEQDWVDTSGVEGDVSICFNVTYFVPEIGPFIQKLHRATRRRVIIGVITTVPSGRPLYPLLYGEPLAPWPTYRELLPVLGKWASTPMSESSTCLLGPRRRKNLHGTSSSPGCHRPCGCLPLTSTGLERLRRPTSTKSLRKLLRAFASATSLGIGSS